MIIISTDSGADLTPAYQKEHGVYVAPMHVIFGEESREDGSFPIQDIFDYYNTTKHVPKTAGVGLSDYMDMFARINAEHPGCQIIHLSYSAVTSVSYQNANIARENFANLHVIDTMHVTVGLGMMVRRALEIRDEYEDSQVEEMVARLEEIASRMRCTFIPEHLNYLLAGGRISNAAYIGANLLQLKPAIKMENGYLVAGKKFRGKLDKILPQFFQDFLKSGPFELDVLYICAVPGVPAERSQLLEDLGREAGFKEICHFPCAGVISCHGGEGAVGVAALAAKV